MKYYHTLPTLKGNYTVTTTTEDVPLFIYLSRFHRNKRHRRRMVKRFKKKGITSALVPVYIVTTTCDSMR